MKIASLICAVICLACLLALPVIGYVSWHQGTRLTALFILPAEIMPLGIGLLAGLALVCTVGASLLARRDRKWAVGALAVVVSVAGVFWLLAVPGTFFLYGVRDRFVAEVGYPLLRRFATELSQDESLPDADGVLYPPGYYGTASPAEQKRWDDLVARFPFLTWKGGAVTVARHGSVQSLWGSALTGHWGFEVATTGALSVPEQDRGQALKIADDLQFVSYYD